MKYLISILALLLSHIDGAQALLEDTSHCSGATGLGLQVLGSGGPIADDGRASTSYLLWVNRQSLVLVDFGGGAFLRFGEAGAQFEDLGHIAISHLHTDHSADLAALFKSGYFSGRKASLSISGPGGGGPYAGIDGFLDSLLNPEDGAYAYLSGYLDGSDGLARLVSTEVDPYMKEVTRVYSNRDAGIEIFALGVPHGPVPALAYKVQAGGKVIVFSGDQNGSAAAFTEFARDADVLLMHMPIPEGTTGAGRNLHAPPSIIGKIAAQTNTRKLVLSHFMARSLRNLEENLEEIRSQYPGMVITAEDLDCIEI